MASFRVLQRLQLLYGIQASSLTRLISTPSQCKFSSSHPKTHTETDEKLHRAIRIFIERQSKQRKFIEKERRDFENGRRHLANIMGWNPDTMTQQDIDRAVEYLFPSGLFDLHSRPKLKPPEEYLPPEQLVPFDNFGRPLHSLFYTAYPDYYEAMQKINLLTMKCQQATAIEQNLTKNTLNIDQHDKLILGGTRWLDKLELGTRFHCKLTQEQYDNFIAAIEYLASFLHAYLYKEQIMAYRVHLDSTDEDNKILNEHKTYISEVLTCPDTGRQYVQAEGKKKDTMIILRCFAEGTGKFTIDGHELDYLPYFQYRELCIAPLIVIDRLNDFDVDVRRETGEIRSIGSLAFAVRLALSRALIQLIEVRDVNALKLAGYLTYDPRVRERHKPAQRGARGKWIWKKR